MTIATITGYDATGANVASLPAPTGPYVYLGYITGTGAIPWTAEDWARYPAAIRIAQSASLAADDAAEADVLDYENGAATIADLAPWAKSAQAAYKAGARPGQRWPAIYASQGSLADVCNALAAAGVTAVGLVVANWNLTRQQAAALVASASGPYPVVGVQYVSEADYDTGVYSLPWVSTLSQHPTQRVATSVTIGFADGTSERFTL